MKFKYVLFNCLGRVNYKLHTPNNLDETKTRNFMLASTPYQQISRYKQLIQDIVPVLPELLRFPLRVISTSLYSCCCCE